MEALFRLARYAELEASWFNRLLRPLFGRRYKYRDLVLNALDVEANTLLSFTFNLPVELVAYATETPLHEIVDGDTTSIARQLHVSETLVSRFQKDATVLKILVACSDRWKPDFRLIDAGAGETTQAGAGT
jgi:hypothetical protein